MGTIVPARKLIVPRIVPGDIRWGHSGTFGDKTHNTEEVAAATKLVIYPAAGTVVATAAD